LWPGFAAELEAASGMEVGLRREGTIALATGEREAAAMAARGSTPRRCSNRSRR
jgi:hypothetical protein